LIRVEFLRDLTLARDLPGYFPEFKRRYRPVIKQTSREMQAPRAFLAHERRQPDRCDPSNGLRSLPRSPSRVRAFKRSNDGGLRNLIECDGQERDNAVFAARNLASQNRSGSEN